MGARVNSITCGCAIIVPVRSVVTEVAVTATWNSEVLTLRLRPTKLR